MSKTVKFFVPVILAVFFSGAQAVSAVNINNCSVLDTAGEIYNLTQDITSSPNTTCMNITADNITLDCGGKMIDGVDNSTSDGIYLNARNNITIKNCNITDWGDGIHVISSSGSVINNTNISSNNGRGIYASSLSYGRIENARVESNSVTGIYLYQSPHNILTGINSSKNDYNVYLETSSNNNTISNSDLVSGNSDGIYISSSHNNTIVSCNISSNVIYGVLIYESTNNNFTGCKIQSNQNQGVRFYNADENTIKDCLINNSGVYEVYATDTSSYDNYFINTTFSKANTSVNGNAIIWIKWYLDIIVRNEAGNPLNNATVNVTNKFNSSVFSGNTNSSGYTPTQTLPEYNQTSSGINYYVNYTVNATMTAYYKNSTQVNLTRSTLATLYLLPFPVPTVEVKTYDLGLGETTIFKPKRIVRIRAYVTSTQGKSYLKNSTIDIINNIGSFVKQNVPMTNISEITSGYLYEYNYTLPPDAQGIWTLNVSAIDEENQKDFDTEKIAILPVTVQIKLVLNSTSDKIYIPGTGERTFAELTTNQYSAPDHYYLASYSSNLLKSVVSSAMNPISILTQKNSNTYGIGTDQRFSNSIVFLVFSKGDWRAVNNRIGLIENGEFLINAKPSFSYGLGNVYPFKILLQYDKINLNNTMRIGRGYNRLTIENRGFTGDGVNIGIER